MTCRLHTNDGMLLVALSMLNVPMMAPWGLKECIGWYVEVESMALRWEQRRPDMAFTRPGHLLSTLEGKGRGGRGGREKR